MKSLILSAILCFAAVVCNNDNEVKEDDLSGFYTLGNTVLNGTVVSTDAWKNFTCVVLGPVHPEEGVEGYTLGFKAERKVNVVLFRSQLTGWKWRMELDKSTSTESDSENKEDKWTAADIIEKVLVKEFSYYKVDENEASFWGVGDFEMHMPRYNPLIPPEGSEN